MQDVNSDPSGISEEEFEKLTAAISPQPNSFNKDRELLEKLKKNSDFNPNGQSESDLPWLHFTIVNNLPETFEYLIDNCADINLPHGVENQTPLLLACSSNNKNFLKTLLQLGAKLQRDDDNENYMDSAIEIYKKTGDSNPLYTMRVFKYKPNRLSNAFFLCMADRIRELAHKYFRSIKKTDNKTNVTILSAELNNNFKDVLKGNVVVLGNLCNNDIEVEGTLFVNGNIEQCNLKITGDVIVLGGMSECTYSSNMGHLYSECIKNCDIKTGGNVIASSFIVNCKVWAFKVDCAHLDGIVFGGEIYVTCSLYCKKLGASYGMTKVYIGIPPAVHFQWNNLNIINRDNGSTP